MKVILVALAFVAVAAAAAIDDGSSLIVAQILKSNSKQDPDGTYSFVYETTNGITRQEEGVLKTVQNQEGKSQDVVVVKGSSTYTNPDGNIETLEFYADETGFHVVGPSVPKVASRR